MTTAPAPRTRRRAALLAAAAVSSLTLSACGLNSPTQTLERYAPADGVEIDGEELDVRDLLVVSHGNGAPAVVVGSLTNQGEEPLTVTVTANGEELSPQITVEPGTMTRIDDYGPQGNDERVILPSLESPAGQSIEVRIDTGNERLAANVPVLLPHGSYEEFADDAGGTVEPAQTGDDDH